MTETTDVHAPSTVGDVLVKLDDRVRLMSAVLAATDFPDKAQQRKPHGTHAHARATRKYLSDYHTHPAAHATQALLDAGTPPEALFTLALRLTLPDWTLSGDAPLWLPAGYIDQLRDFHSAAHLDEWWKKERAVWDKALAESQRVFQKVTFRDFLLPFVDTVTEEFIFIPNVSFPTDKELGLRVNHQLICIAPPPMAWGDSPPWPYDEETQMMHSYRVSLAQYARLILGAMLRANPEKLMEAAETELPLNDQFRAQFPGWEGQFIELFVTAMVAMYLESHLNEGEYKSFVLMERKVRGMNILPGTVSVLRRYLQEKGGSKYNNLPDFLPYFPKQLRVAKRIVNL
ncbi:MAG: hypothetical protein H7Y11_02285 [Armatimonadetes bacterium]|nr:hypothetical protein [Anaerolineae bacterium]